MNKESGGSTSLISRIHNSIPDGIYIATSLSSIKTTEFELVQGLLHVLQGNSSQFFVWDEICGRYYAKVGIFVTHLSQTGLHEVLNQFLYAASCLRLTDVVIRKIETDGKGLPTLRAFANSASAWLERLRDIALKEEVKINEFNPRTVPTLLGLANSLSSLCSGAESLSQIVHEAVPKLWLEFINSVPAAEVAVHILDFLYKKLNEACLVQGGEEEAYRMLLYLFVGSLLPYIASLDSWIHEGILDDPCSELFFYENKSVSISDTEFWEKSYLLRSLTLQKFDGEHSGAAFQQQACPLFLKDIAKEIVSAGKSLQLIRHVPMTLYSSRSTGPGCENIDGVRSNCAATVAGEVNSGYSAEGLTLVEVFFLSVAGVIGYGDHVYNYFLKDDFSSLLSCILGSESERQQSEARDWRNSSSTLTTAKKTWVEFLHDILLERQSCRKLKMSSSLGKSESAEINLQDEFSSTIPSLSGSEVEGHEFEVRDVEVSSAAKVIPRKIGLELLGTIIHERQSSKVEKSSSRRKGESAKARLASVESFCPENPVTTVCQKLLKDNKAALQTLNLSNDSILPPLNDENLWEAIFNVEKNVPFPTKRTNSAFGFQFSESQHQRSLDDRRLLETMLPFPTVLPCCQEDLQMSELLPLQKNSSLSSRILRWIQTAEPKGTRLPMMILQECLIVYIKKQVDIIGSHMLSKLLREWRLMDELEVLRAIYLLGSGDLLRHFLTVIFSKLDKGESWDDDFELNMILQESITNSADAMLLSAPDTLVVSVLKPYGLDGSDLQNAATAVSTPRKSHEGGLGINGLDVLGFTYKVSWPLELIANTEAIKKYNQVMHFLIKVKRAKFVLDKSRRWIWKGKGAVTISRKHHWLVEQKLLHFVDAFHQYVMDRVYHSAWREMCQGMTAARSLDEVIEVHEAYLLSIQRQCFVVPDKLGALIASRVNTILGLALDFYSVQQTLHSGGAVSAIKARCEMEVDRIEKQFDDCIAFLLRVLSFKLNVGHFPHLADLVTRINYNYYYMSDNGNMITAPGSESVRLPKTFPSRPG